LNITIKYSQTETGLVFNSRLWILLSLLGRWVITFSIFPPYLHMHVCMAK